MSRGATILSVSLRFKNDCTTIPSLRDSLFREFLNSNYCCRTINCFGHPQILSRCLTVYGRHTTSAASGRRALGSTIDPEHLPAVGDRGYVKIRDLRARMPHYLRVIYQITISLYVTTINAPGGRGEVLGQASTSQSGVFIIRR